MKNYRLILDDLLKANAYLSSHILENSDILRAVEAVSSAITEVKQLKEYQDKELESRKQEYLEKLKADWQDHDCKWSPESGCSTCAEYMEMTGLGGLSYYAKGKR